MARCVCTRRRSLRRSRIRLAVGAPPSNGSGRGAAFARGSGFEFFFPMPQLVRIGIERNDAAVTAASFSGMPEGNQIKFQSVKLARKYLERVSSELEATKVGPNEEELMLQGVRFAFRVHQFASGFDVDTMRAFQELKEKASMCHFQRQKQNLHPQQQRLVGMT